MTTSTTFALVNTFPLLRASCCAAALICAPMTVHADTAEPKTSTVVPLLSQALEDMQEREALLIEVTLPPGGADPVHRHDAEVFVYVLEGSAVMQVEGDEEVVLNPGDTFQERPDDIHLVGRNASDSEPVRFLAFFVKKQSVPPVLPVE